jgi:hypothetical protein
MIMGPPTQTAARWRSAAAPNGEGDGAVKAEGRLLIGSVRMDAPSKSPVRSRGADRAHPLLVGPREVIVLPPINNNLAKRLRTCALRAKTCCNDTQRGDYMASAFKVARQAS